jgi:hypothetical protein
MDVHSSLLRQICAHEPDDDFDGANVDLPALALEQARGLKLTVQRFGAGCWYDSDDKDQLRDLLLDIKTQFAGREERWHDIDPESLDAWASLGQDLPKRAEFGCWEEPAEWGFLIDDSDADHIFVSESDNESAVGDIAAGGFVCGFDRERRPSTDNLLGSTIFGAPRKLGEDWPEVSGGSFPDLDESWGSLDEPFSHIDRPSRYMLEPISQHEERTSHASDISHSFDDTDDTLPPVPGLEVGTARSESEGTHSDPPPTVGKMPEVHVNEVPSLSDNEGESMPALIPQGPAE